MEKNEDLTLSAMLGGWNKDAGSIDRILSIINAIKEKRNSYVSIEERVRTGWERKNVGKGRLKEGPSISSHISLSSNLGLINENQFLSAYGKTLYVLQKSYEKTPRYFLLALILEKDRSCIIPFLEKIKNSKGMATTYERIAISEVFNNLRKIFPNIEIPKLNPKTRGSWSHASVRIRLLKSLYLWDYRTRIINTFGDYKFRRMPSNYFFMIGKIFDLDVAPIPENKIFDLIKDVHKTFLKYNVFSNYISAKATFNYINEICLNDKKAVDYNNFMKFIRTDERIILSQSFDPDDVLFFPK